MSDETLQDEHQNSEWRTVMTIASVGLLGAGIPSPAVAICCAMSFGITVPCMTDPGIFNEAAEGWREIKESFSGEDGVKEKLNTLLDDLGRAWEGDAAETFTGYMNDKFLANLDTVAGACDSMASACDSVADLILGTNIALLSASIATTVGCLAANASIFDGGAIAKTSLLTAYMAIAGAVIAAIVTIMITLGSQAQSLENVVNSSGNLFSETESKVDNKVNPHPDDLPIIGNVGDWDRTQGE